MGQKLRAVAYNIAVLAAVAFGAHELSLAFSPAIGVVYASFVLFMLYYVLRKHLCTNCVYYGKKICYTGWGWLASKLFSRKSGNFEVGRRAAGLTWGVFLFSPFVAFLTLKDWWWMVFWIALTVFFFADHVGHCRSCPMYTRCYSKEPRG